MLTKYTVSAGHYYLLACVYRPGYIHVTMTGQEDNLSHMEIFQDPTLITVLYNFSGDRHFIVIWGWLQNPTPC